MYYNTKINQMFVQPTKENLLTEEKVPVNREKDVCVYYNVKNKSGMFE